VKWCYDDFILIHLIQEDKIIMATGTKIQRPVTAPYTSDVHTITWEAWDAHVAKKVAEGYAAERIDTYEHRSMFMDGFIAGLNQE
jgi:hypothetical protein